jgi:acyl-CoA synthetase (NDP forming)
VTAPTESRPAAAGGQVSPAAAGGQVSPAAAGGQASSAVTAMLEARSVALVGASARPGSLGARMIEEVTRSPSRPRTYLVNPRYADIGGVPCLPSLAEVPEPVDLALLAVPDAALETQLAAAAENQARSAVIFGSAYGPHGTTGLRDRLAAVARDAGMAVCGAGCMGFVNVARGLRAIGYVEPDPLPAGPVALVTHSGSVFSALLRARRGFGFTVAVSSGQELVTTAADYARYALTVPGTKVLALVLEAIRDAAGLRAVLADALAADVPVVLLSVGASEAGQALVAAHSGALAADGGAWEALAAAYGVHRVGDLAELADTLEIFASGRRAAPGTGIATVHDSGLERAHTADLAAEAGVPFAPLAPVTTARLAGLLDEGLAPGNPLDVWGTGRDTEELFTGCLDALAADPSVGAVALAVDLVPEFDGDESYPRAVLAAAASTTKPVAVLTGIPAAVDQAAAARLRAVGIPVLEGTRTGLLAVRHLLDHATPPPLPPPAPPPPRHQAPRAASARAIPVRAIPVRAIPERPGTPRRDRLPAGGPDLFALLSEYGIPVARTEPAASRDTVLTAADTIGYPVVLKTAEPGIAHKSDVGGVRLGLADPAGLAAAYDDLAARLGPNVLVGQTAPPGTELALGLVRDPALGPLLIISAGGVLIEIFNERVVLLAPVIRPAALAAIQRLRIAPVLTGVRGQPPADLDAIADAIEALSRLACDLGDTIDALDVNPLICGPRGALAVDALLLPRPAPPLP